MMNLQSNESFIWGDLEYKSWQNVRNPSRYIDSANTFKVVFQFL